MFAGDNVRPQTFAQDRQFSFRCAPVGELEQAQPLVVRDCEHRAQRGLDPLGKQTRACLRACWWLAEDARKSFAKTAGRFETAAVFRFVHSSASPHLAQRQAHASRAMISLKCHSIVTLELPPRR